MKKWFVTLLFSLLSVASYGSYCYGYSITNELYTQDGRLCIRLVGRDGISYVTDTTIMITTDMDLSGFKFISENDWGWTFETDSGYFLLHRSWRDDSLKVQKLYNRSEVSEMIDGAFYKVGGVWQYVYVKYAESTASKKAMPGLPAVFNIISMVHDGHEYNYLLSDRKNLYLVNPRVATLTKTLVSPTGFEVVGRNNWSWNLLLKSAEGFYQFCPNEDPKRKLKKIPRLNVAQTRIYMQDGAYDESYIYDDDTFYELDSYFNFEDLTPEFVFFDKKNGFLSAEFVGSDYGVSFFDADSTLWVRANISMQDGPTATFYPLPGASYMGRENSFIFYKGKVYQNGLDAAYQMNDFSPDHVSWLESLKLVGKHYLTDGKKVYRDTKIIDWLTPLAKMVYETGGSYTYLDGRKLFLIHKNGDLMKPHMTMHLNDSVFNEVGPALVNREYIFVNYQMVKNTTGMANLRFIDSTVRIIRLCDGAGTPPAKIDKFYFFGCDDGVYYYYSGLTELKKIEIAGDQVSYSSDSFNDLKKLEAMTDQPPIEYDWQTD